MGSTLPLYAIQERERAQQNCTWWKHLVRCKMKHLHPRRGAYGIQRASSEEWNRIAGWGRELTGSRPNLHKKRVPQPHGHKGVESKITLYTGQKLTCPLDVPFCRSDTVFRRIKWLKTEGSLPHSSRGTRGAFQHTSISSRLSPPPHPTVIQHALCCGTPRSIVGGG